MPVPAFRNSRSRVRRRRSHHALKPIQLLKNKETGEYTLHHHTKQDVAVVAPAVAKKKATKAKTAPVAKAEATPVATPKAETKE